MSFVTSGKTIINRSSANINEENWKMKLINIYNGTINCGSNEQVPEEKILFDLFFSV